MFHLPVTGFTDLTGSCCTGVAKLRVLDAEGIGLETSPFDGELKKTAGCSPSFLFASYSSSFSISVLGTGLPTNHHARPFAHSTLLNRSSLLMDDVMLTFAFSISPSSRCLPMYSIILGVGSGFPASVRALSASVT